MTRKVEDLVSHLKKYKDAVIIVGPGILENPIIKKEEFNGKYTLKAFRRDKKTFWQYYLDNLNKEMDDKANSVIDLIDKHLSEYSSIVIDQNINSRAIDKGERLHGSIYEYKCPKCKTVYTEEYMKLDGHSNSYCELCSTDLRPSVLFYGEKYNRAIYDKIVDLMNETHTVILIGMDYTEVSLIDILVDYGVIKSIASSGDEENTPDEKMIVAIQNEKEEIDPNEIVFCEFLVKGDIKESIDRLLSKF